MPRANAQIEGKKMWKKWRNPSAPLQECLGFWIRPFMQQEKGGLQHQSPLNQRHEPRRVETAARKTWIWFQHFQLQSFYLVFHYWGWCVLCSNHTITHFILIKPRIRSSLSCSPPQHALRFDGAATPLWKNWLRADTTEQTLNHVTTETHESKI